MVAISLRSTFSQSKSSLTSLQSSASTASTGTKVSQEGSVVLQPMQLKSPKRASKDPSEEGDSRWQSSYGTRKQKPAGGCCCCSRAKKKKCKNRGSVTVDAVPCHILVWAIISFAYCRKQLNRSQGSGCVRTLNLNHAIETVRYYKIKPVITK